MKILNKREIPKKAINHLSDFHFKDSMNIYKTCTPKTYFFLINDTTVESNNTLHFRCNPSQKYKNKLECKIRDEKRQ